MNSLAMLALPIDLFAIAVLAYVIYYRRHRRSDLAFAYVALNVGVFAVATLLVTQQVQLGLAFALFGVLSIIRLRSDQINQREIGYYFVALALGLVNGVGSALPSVMVALNALLLVTMFVADHPRLSNGVQRRTLTLDVVHHDESTLCADLAARLGGRILQVDVAAVDYVRDTMAVDVRFRPAKAS